jgi:hypothetical protein
MWLLKNLVDNHTAKQIPSAHLQSVASVAIQELQRQGSDASITDAANILGNIAKGDNSCIQIVLNYHMELKRVFGTLRTADTGWDDATILALL